MINLTPQIQRYIDLWNELPVLVQGVFLVILSFAVSFVLVIFWYLKGMDSD